MKKNTTPMVSLSEAERDFSHVADMADQSGAVYICENGTPKYRLVQVEEDASIDMTDEEKIDFVAMRVLKKYRHAFEELAK